MLTPLLLLLIFCVAGLLIAQKRRVGRLVAASSEQEHLLEGRAKEQLSRLREMLNQQEATAVDATAITPNVTANPYSADAR
jgi:hypothetical protein